jgi:hypothetical protein
MANNPALRLCRQRIRKRIEEAFGWIKTIAVQAKSRFRGRDRVGGRRLQSGPVAQADSADPLIAKVGPAAPRLLPAAGSSSK